MRPLRFMPALFAMALVLVACGGDDGPPEEAVEACEMWEEYKSDLRAGLEGDELLDRIEAAGDAAVDGGVDRLNVAGRALLDGLDASATSEEREDAFGDMELACYEVGNL